MTYLRQELPRIEVGLRKCAGEAAGIAVEDLQEVGAGQARALTAQQSPAVHPQASAQQTALSVSHEQVVRRKVSPQPGRAAGPGYQQSMHHSMHGDAAGILCARSCMCSAV